MTGDVSLDALFAIEQEARALHDRLSADENRIKVQRREAWFAYNAAKGAVDDRIAALRQEGSGNDRG